MMLRKIEETDKGRLYFKTNRTVTGGRCYNVYLQLKTGFGGFDVLYKTFGDLSEALEHGKYLLTLLMTYEQDVKNPLRMFV